MLLSVRNGERFLAAALDSLRAQTLRDFELIAVNDGSTDATAQILAEYARRDARIHVYSQPPLGVIDGRNAAFSHSSGGYITVLDADDVEFRDRLEKQAQFLDDNPSVGLVGGWAIIVNEDGEEIGRLDYPTEDAQLRASLLEGCTVCQPLMRRAAFEGAGGYRRAFMHSAEDYDLYLRIADKWQIANLAAPVLYYRWHGSGVTSSVDIRVQLLETVAAQISACRRRRHSPDPLEGASEISLDLLQRSAIRSTTVTSRLASAAVARANTLVSLGRPAAAISVLEQTLPDVDSRSVDRRMAALVAIAYARARLGLRSYPLAITWLIRAIVADPAAVVRTLWRAVQGVVRAFFRR